MISTFVTLPMLIFASFIPISAIKKHWIFIAILILSILMVAGPHSPFWQTITSAVPALKLSRFPSSDYRVFIAIPIIILGTAGLKAIIECRIIMERIYSESGFRHYLVFSRSFFTIFSAFEHQCLHKFSRWSQSAIFILCQLSMLFIIYYSRKNKLLDNVSGTNKPVILSRVGIDTNSSSYLIDGLRVVSDMQTWKEITIQ